MRKIIGLDECVINALNLFVSEGVTRLRPFKFKRPIVIGSGNAEVTGKILFEDTDAVFANESNYIKKLGKSKNIDGCIIVSSSGQKHAPIIAKEARKRRIPVILITNNKEALAKKFVDEMIVFPKNSEPYTYNTSTYMGMILSKTKENPKEILNFINNLDKKKFANLTKYDSFFFVLPDKFENIRDMFLTKFDELFGSNISCRSFTVEQTKHAKTLVPSKKELFISLGYDNKLFGDNRLNIPLPKNASYATLMCVGYYIIGNIQSQNRPYFKENIEKYAKQVSKLFNQEIKPIAD